MSKKELNGAIQRLYKAASKVIGKHKLFTAYVREIARLEILRDRFA